MIQKVKILDRITDGLNRFLKVNFNVNNTKNALQYHCGGDDYNPADNTEAIGGFISDNPTHSVIFAYKDSIEKIAEPGEKRIYATDSNGRNTIAQIHLKNNGDIVINASKIYINAQDTIITGTLTADVIKANNGASGAFDKIQSANGIVTGGS